MGGACSLTFLEGTHARLGRESPIYKAFGGRGKDPKTEGVLNKICALIGVC